MKVNYSFCLKTFFIYVLLFHVGCIGVPFETSTSDSAANTGLVVSTPEVLSLAEMTLRNCQEVGGFAGLGLAPTRFLKLSVIFAVYGDTDLYVRLLSDKNPVVRAMGLTCLSQADHGRYEQIFPKYKNDAEKLYISIDSCQPSESSVGELARSLYLDPHYLGHKLDYSDFQRYVAAVKGGKVIMTVRQRN